MKHFLVMGLPADERRAIKEWNRTHLPKPQLYFYSPEELAPVVPKKSVYERFWTIIRRYGIEYEVEITPISGWGDINGFPVIFQIGIDGRFFANLQYMVVKWDWWECNPGKQFPPEEFGNIIEAWFE